MQKVDRDGIKYLMELANINPSKNKGQNFLVDAKISENIVNLLKNNANSKVLEIGPGLGSLTFHLQNRCNNLTLVDLDENIINYLSLEVNDNVKLVNADALKYNVSLYEYIISNIPYNITTELITYLLINASNCKQFVFMCQKENFNHFNDTNGSEYGPVSVLIHLLGNIKKVFDVKPGSFVPAPKCVSTVFSVDMFEIDTNSRKEIVNTFKLTLKLFNNRRKTIFNNLSTVIGKEKTEECLSKLGIDKLLRPEQISPKQFFELHNLVGDVN